MTQCSMNCGREAHHKRMGVCQTCYWNMWYWTKQGPKRILERARKLALYERRMKSINNVIPLVKRKRA